jgi:uncharacterized protein YndB with AHSA1/START domain
MVARGAGEMNVPEEVRRVVGIGVPRARVWVELSERNELVRWFPENHPEAA